MRPDATGGQLTILAAGTGDPHGILQVENGSGTLVDLTARVINCTHKVPCPDNPIASLTVELVRQDLFITTDSLAPLNAASLLNRLDDTVTYSPLLEMGRVVVMKQIVTTQGAARPADGSIIEQFRGRISHVSGPEEWSTITIQCTDEAGVLAKTWTEGAAATAAVTVPLARTRIGLIDYFVPGTKEFDTADWEVTSGVTLALTSITNTLRLDPSGTGNLWQAIRLSAAPVLDGCYVYAHVQRDTSNGHDYGPGILQDVTSGSIDFSGACFAGAGGAPVNAGFAGPMELIAGARTTHGSQTSNLAGSSEHDVFGWVEPDSATPAALAKHNSTTKTDTGPLSRQLAGKAGFLLYNVGSSVDLVLFTYYAHRDRYVWCYGLEPGQIAKIRTSGAAMRFEATADGTGLAKIDVFGDTTPLLSYDLAIYENDGTTLVEALHPTDADGVVWGGDHWTTEVETTVPPIVLIGGTLVQDVLQGVIDREYVAGTYPIETPSVPSPPFVITRDLTGTALDDFVWNVVAGYAGLIGWLFWMRYNASSIAKLTFFEPDRDKVSIDATFAKVFSVSQMDKNDEFIRNVVEGISQTIAGEPGDLHAKYSDSTSIAKYGNIRRYARIVEEVGSVIVTQTMLDNLTIAALADWKDPDTIFAATVPYFWPGEVGVDLYTFNALPQFFDDPTDWAPFSIVHQFTEGFYRGRATSTMTLRGKPSAGQNLWRRLGGDESIPTTPLDPKWRSLLAAVDTRLGPAKGCRWVKAIEQGKKVRAVRFRTRETAEEWSEWSAPLRAAGAAGKVFTATLGIGEWEHEVDLNGDELSNIGAEWQDDNGLWTTIQGSEAIDANLIPAFLDGYPLVQALNIFSAADDDARSTRFVKTAGGGGAFSDAFDDNEGTMAIPVPDGDTWTVDVTISNKIEADWGTGGELLVTRTVTVTNAAEPAEGGVPTNLTIGLTEPANGFDEIEIEVTANQAPTDYRWKAYASYEYIPYDDDTLPQTFGEIEITSQLNPNPLALALPTVATAFDFPTNFEREDSTPDGRIQFQFRFTIVDLNAAPGADPIFDTGAYPFVVAYDCLVP